jgi:hypothetical protein
VPFSGRLKTQIRPIFTQTTCHQKKQKASRQSYILPMDRKTEKSAEYEGKCKTKGKSSSCLTLKSLQH